MACAVFPPYGRGGGPISSALVAKALAGEAAQVRVVVVGDAEAKEQRGNIEVITTAPLNVYRDWLKRDKPALKKITWHLLENFNPIAYVRIKKELQAYQPDVLMTIDTQNVNVASWAAAKSLGIPSVHVAHSYWLMCWRSSLFHNGVNCSHCQSCKLFSTGKKYLSKYVDALITETAFLGRIHQQAGYFPKAQAYVIPAPVDMPISSNRIKVDGLRVGFIGSHTRNKGIETLAAAAQRLSNRQDIRFLIAGSGDDDYTSALSRSYCRV